MPEQLKIAMLSVHSCPLGKLGNRDTGGMNVYIKELSCELGRRGHHVDIYTRAHDPEHQQVIELDNNVRLIHLGIGSDDDIPKLAIYAYLQGFICGVENFRKSRGLNYDLLHSHYWLSGLIGKQLKLWWRVPHLCMFHTLGATKNNIGIGEDEPELRIEGERQVVQDCDLIIASTETEKRELIQHYGASPDKIGIIPCGVNMELFRPLGKDYARQQLGLDHESLVLFVGRVEPLKGLRQMLKALPLIASQNPPRLMIVGGDEHNKDEMAILQQLSGELNIEDRVTFVGSVSQDKLPLFYSAADICVIPSYYESFGMVALESLACGTPIVSTDVGGMRDVVRHAEIGYLIPDNSPQQLASRTSESLSRNGEGRQHFKVRREAVAKFAWPHIADRVLQEYRNLLQERLITPNL